MTLNPLAKKRRIRPGYRIVLLNAPAGMAELLSPCPQMQKWSQAQQAKRTKIRLA